ncbi:MAG: hypothetical protein U0941_08510 [Planctomycetaceae bacterium]
MDGLTEWHGNENDRRYNTRPPSPATGYSHPSCFACGLNDCSRTISREHYVSQSILTLFGNNNITAAGLPWIPDGQMKSVSVASLTSKILCTRHNESLSPLDDVASAFFRFFTVQQHWVEAERLTFRGNDLERWLLKTLCGLAMSGNATLNGMPIKSWRPPLQWLEILFGGRDVESPAGLHFITGKHQAAEGTLHVQPVFKSVTGHPIALAFVVSGIGFLFAMEALPPMRQPSITGGGTSYRPKALRIQRGESTREGQFGWPDGQVISLNVSGSRI